MSFSTDAKAEIIKLPTGKKCCKLAYAAAFLLDSEDDGEERLLCNYSNADIATAAQRAISMAFGKESAPSAGVKSHSGYDIAFTSRDAVSLVKSIRERGILSVCVCPECRNVFLRGAFAALASVTDPERQYHLEFLVKSTANAKLLYAFLNETVGEPAIVNRKSGTGLVYKGSSFIEDVLSVIGATQAYFTLINGKIEREIRNNENRATNCETRNISMSVDAAQKQIAAINKLQAEDKFDILPPELKKTAEMRLLYPSLPLSELAARFAPPLTKSGLNHRLKKITELAEEQ